MEERSQICKNNTKALLNNYSGEGVKSILYIYPFKNTCRLNFRSRICVAWLICLSEPSLVWHVYLRKTRLWRQSICTHSIEYFDEKC